MFLQIVLIDISDNNVSCNLVKEDAFGRATEYYVFLGCVVYSADNSVAAFKRKVQIGVFLVFLVVTLMISDAKKMHSAVPANLLIKIQAYIFSWNKNGNLEGHEKTTLKHRFTWQPHGSQLTIFEDVPPERLHLKVKRPGKLDKEKVLDAVGYQHYWISLIDDDK